ncbi:MAG: hypothetical protein K2Q22_17480, partial [Cytophagales bacterium]|nr:hypothetical protein [Cytophagales bacterium]
AKYWTSFQKKINNSQSTKKISQYFKILTDFSIKRTCRPKFQYKIDLKIDFEVCKLVWSRKIRKTNRVP